MCINLDAITSCEEEEQWSLPALQGCRILYWFALVRLPLIHVSMVADRVILLFSPDPYFGKGRIPIRILKKGRIPDPASKCL